ncbi:hypothetical protein SMICM304S_05215 [Streptomyces microflavus]
MRSFGLPPPPVTEAAGGGAAEHARPLGPGGAVTGAVGRVVRETQGTGVGAVRPGGTGAEHPALGVIGRACRGAGAVLAGEDLAGRPVVRDRGGPEVRVLGVALDGGAGGGGGHLVGHRGVRRPVLVVDVAVVSASGDHRARREGGFGGDAGQFPGQGDQVQRTVLVQKPLAVGGVHRGAGEALRALGAGEIGEAERGGGVVVGAQSDLRLQLAQFGDGVAVGVVLGRGDRAAGRSRVGLLSVGVEVGDGRRRVVVRLEVGARAGGRGSIRPGRARWRRWVRCPVPRWPRWPCPYGGARDRWRSVRHRRRWSRRFPRWWWPSLPRGWDVRPSGACPRRRSGPSRPCRR